MQFLKSLLFITAAFTSASFAAANPMPQTLCLLNVTLIGDTPYFIEKAYNQWKSDPSASAQIFCSDAEASIPVQITITGRGLAYPFNGNSKIRLSVVVPQADLPFLLDRSLDVTLYQKRLMIENIYDSNQHENTELHIENSLSEDEMRSISKAVVSIQRSIENK